MRLLLTGATGYLGRHLTQALVAAGHEVVAIVRGPARGEVLPAATVRMAFDGSAECLHPIVAESRPDAVLHLATHYLASHRPEDIQPLIEGNVLFGTVLLDAMAAAGVSKLVNFGTAFQYFDGPAYDPVSLYAATKQAFEAMADYYVNAHGLTMLTLALSDTYGPADPRGKIIAALIKAANEGGAFSMSPGDQILSFVHVLDVVAAVQVALRRIMNSPPGTRETFAVRGADLLSLRELVALVEELSGRSIDVKWGARPYRVREVMRPWLGELLPGWEASMSLRRGIGSLIDV